MFCINCGQPVKAQAAFCASCGQAVHQPVRNRNKSAYLFGGSVTIAFVVTAIVFLALSGVWNSTDRADSKVSDEMATNLSGSSVTGKMPATPVREENDSDDLSTIPLLSSQMPSPTPHTASTPQQTATSSQNALTPELIIQTPLPPQAIDEIESPMEMLAGVWHGSVSGGGEWTDPWGKSVRLQIRSFCQNVEAACLIDLQDGEIHRLDDVETPDGYCFIDEAKVTWRCVYQREDGNLEYNARGPLWGESGVLYREGPFDCSQVTNIPNNECEALVALYNNTDGPNWIEGSGWLADNNPCNWFGVMCGAGHVTELRLEGFREGNQLIRFGLNGDIPSEIGNLTNLRRLNLNSNQLSGSIPSEMGSLANLWYLSLGDNQLSGSIPGELRNLANLRQLFLYKNNLNGSIPAELDNLTNLDWLSLWENQLSGSIPRELGNLANLQRLELSTNQLSGSLPAELGNLAKLEGLSLSNNQLNGNIPGQLSNLANLENLFLDSNLLSGNIPPELGNLPSLQQMQLGGNQLSGQIPSELGNLANLRGLGLSSNQLNESIPVELGNLTSLQLLRLHNNQLSGGIPPELGNLADLHLLDLSRNQLSGSIPQEFSRLSNLSWFLFHNTSVCAPDDSTMHDWLAGIGQLYGTGRVCGQPAAAIMGIVTNNEGDPLADVEVVLYRDTSMVWWQRSVVMQQRTDGDGRYEFGELGQGINYYLHFHDSSGTGASKYFENKITISSSDPVTLTLGARRIIDAQLGLPMPSLADVTIHNRSFTASTDLLNGITHIAGPIGSSADITFSRTIVCEDGSTPEAVTLHYLGQTFALIVDHGIYTATIRDTDAVMSGAVIFRTTCASEETDTLVARVTRYQPGGRITDMVTGLPIAEAKVWLYQVPDWEPKVNANDIHPNTCQSQQSKPINAPWNQAAPTDVGVIVNSELTMVAPRVSVQYTNDAGHYGWDVPAGCWYVFVEAEGYEPLTSPVVGVSLKIMDLDLALIPIAR